MLRKRRDSPGPEFGKRQYTNEELELGGDSCTTAMGVCRESEQQSGAKELAKVTRTARIHV